MTYVVLRGATVLTVATTADAAQAAAEGPGTRVEARRGPHWRWTCPCPVCRDWWAITLT